MRNAESLSNLEIVCVAAYLLGGEHHLVDIEDIALRAYDIAPTRFCWRRYPDKVDLRAIQYALKNAVSGDRALLEGSIKRGYMLTPRGLAWAQANGIRSEMGGSRKASVDEALDQERLRLVHTKAYRLFASGRAEAIEMRDFEEFARVNDYFPDHLRQERFRRLDHAVGGNQSPGI
jgi:hypothetical protein